MSAKRFLPTFSRITLEYFLIISIAGVILTVFPGFKDYLPLGAGDRLFDVYRASGELEGSAYAGRLQDGPAYARPLFLFLCFLTAIIVSLPVGRTYIGTHTVKKRSASMAKALVLLPVAVSGLVLIVQNDLALAFSLAGIVAGCGIRFRSNIREFTDTLYFMVAIGIGLAAGTGALGIALMMSMVFCYSLLIVFSVGYGEDPNVAMSDKAEEEPLEPDYEV